MKVLVAEHSPLQKRLIATLLDRWRHEVVAVEDGDSAWSVLDGDNPPTMAILDWEMPGRNGLDICRQLRERETGRYVYALLLTDCITEHSLVEALENGADDYLAKPFDPLELRARLSTGSRILRLEDQLVSLASRDALTALLNRGAIMEALKNELARAQRKNTPVGILMADVDHFKKINDTRGHLVGDVVLQQVACQLIASVRKYDSVGRYGGEEFLVVLPDCDEATAFSLAERIRLAVRKHWGNKQNLPDVTVSIGVTASGQQTEAEFLLRQADQALYRAKNNGRDRVECTNQTLQSLTVTAG
jgi:two-component system, cell cycle response regulator